MSDVKETLRLTQADRDRLSKFLLLARSAPMPGQQEQPPVDERDGVFPRYNFELYQGLRQLGLEVTPSRDLTAFFRHPGEWNYVFTIFNRAPMRNPEVFVSSVCAYHGIPYLGAPPNIRALAEDKYFTKLAAASLGIPVIPGQPYVPGGAPPDFAGPYFIKPRFGAASEGVEDDSIQDTWAGAEKMAQRLREQGKEVLVERCIPGHDVTQPVLGGPMRLPAMREISAKRYGIATYRQKRLFEMDRRREVLSEPELARQADQYTAQFVRQLAPFDYLRVDYRLDTETGRLWLMEFNIACNLGSHAAVAQAALERGIDHASLLEHLVVHSVHRQTQERNLF